MSGAVARFWRRSRDWPLLGQFAFALLVIFVAVAVAAGISDAVRRDGADRTAGGGLAPSGSTTSSSTSRPTTSSEQPTSTSSTTATTATTATTIPRPPATTRHLLPLTIAVQTHEASYDRDANFGGWIDQRGCQDTRAVLLISVSRAPVTFTTASRCTVKSGRWIDPWSGVVTTVAHQFQIDHTVPLFNAWVSGAWSWTHAQRVAYANDLRDFGHLVPIDASENESKGADGPDEWRPPRRGVWCLYAIVWDRIKANWHLSATRTEWAALVRMAATC